MTSIRDIRNKVQQTLESAGTNVANTVKNEMKTATEQAVTALKDGFNHSVPQTVSFEKSLGTAHLPGTESLLQLPWLGEGSAGRPGWLLRQPGPPTTDGTQEFKALNSAVVSGKNVLPPDANKYEYLVIGGLFGKHLPGYMDDNVKGLRDRGLSAHQVPVDSDASVEHNAEVIRQAIEEAHAQGKQVVLIGHSKGGVDAAAALAMHPELKKDVRAMVAIQSPFGGSPIAQDIENTPGLRPFVNGVVKDIFKGSPQSVKDLSYDSREAFLKKYPLPTDVPTVSVATSRLSLRSVLLGTEEYMDARYGFKSDGLVVPDDAIMPGSKVVRLNDMDHAEASLKGVPGFANYQPADITQALVAMALEQPAAH